MKYQRNNNFIKAIDKYLQSVRKSKNILQEELAYTSELELIQIGRIERGTINKSISNVAQIADALEIQPKELFDF